MPEKPLTGVDRGKADDTLNFLLPASACTGQRTLLIRTRFPGDPDVESEHAVGLDFESVPSLRVRGIGVHITGPGALNLPAPSEPGIDDLLTLMRRMGPVSTVELGRVLRII